MSRRVRRKRRMGCDALICTSDSITPPSAPSPQNSLQSAQNWLAEAAPSRPRSLLGISAPSPSSPPPHLMGPRKAAIKRIENATSRRLIFCTRRLALLKKARELSALCDAEVALIGFSSSGNSLFEYAGPRSMQELIQAYFNAQVQAEGSSLPPCSFSLRDSQIQVAKLKEEVQRLEEEERGNGGVKVLKLLSIEELEKLENELASDLTRVRQTKDLLIAEQRQELLMKEQKLRRENEMLRRELKWTKYQEAEEALLVTGNYEDSMSSANSK